VSQYSLQVGSTGAGSSNISSMLCNCTTQTVSGLPASGTLYVRLGSNVGAATAPNWQYADYTYSVIVPATPAVMMSPTPGSGVSGSSVTFSWSPGTGVSQYSLQVGSTGAGSSNISSVPCNCTTQTVSGLPASGTLYVRLGSNLGTATAPNWQYADYTYSVIVPATPAVMMSPTPGSGVSGTLVTFSWSKGVAVSEYFLRVGTTGPGSYDMFSMPTGSSTTQLVSGLGTSGTMYVRLFSNLGTPTAVNWQYTDYTYPIVPPVTPATMITPVSGSTTGLSAVFTWGGGVGISQYLLQAGTTGAGSSNVFSLEVGTATSQLVSGIPAMGGTLYVRLWSNAGTAAAPNWKFVDYTYQMAKAATMSSPASGLTLSTTTTFTWNAGGGASGYELYIGTVQGGCNLGDYKVGTALSTTVKLPARSTLYVRLWTIIGGAATYNDYVYTTGR
jgi:hypothetical protein